MKIAFLYAGGRESRWSAALRGELPSDFFYGAVELARAGHDISCVDAIENPHSLLARGYNLLAGARTPVRTRGEHVVAVGAVLDRLRHADVVVATSTSHAIALAMWKRWKRLSFGIVGIHCGLVNFPVDGARRKSTMRALSEQEVVLFAESERAETLSRFELRPERVHANAFGVDMRFWTTGGVRGNFILSVGNDGRRDYATLIDAVRTLDVPTKIVTSRELPTPLPPHVEHLKGSWHRPALTDEELRDLYRSAALVVIPLTDSLQPSGQSVALQAMACGTPVILSRTSGLWIGSDFADGTDLLLVDAGNPKALRTVIVNSLADTGLRQRMGGSAREAVLRHGNIEDFARRLDSVLADRGAQRASSLPS